MAAVMYTVEAPMHRVSVLPGTSATPRRRPVAARRSNRSAATFWRRRIVAVGIALCTVLMATRAGAALGGTTPLTTSGPRPHLVTHVVAPGDTLWKIAAELDPSADPREIVDLLVQARHTTALTPGETIIWNGH